MFNVKNNCDGEAAGHHGRAVLLPGVHHCVEGAGHVPDCLGGPHHPHSPGGCKAHAGDHEAGGTDEEGAVDGVSPGARLGEEGQLPHPTVIVLIGDILVKLGATG